MLILIGLILPFFIDVVNKKVSDDDTRYLISIAICAIFGIIVGFVQNDFYQHVLIKDAIESICIQIVAMFGTAQLSFKFPYKAIGLKDTFREAIDFKK